MLLSCVYVMKFEVMLAVRCVRSYLCYSPVFM